MAGRARGTAKATKIRKRLAPSIAAESSNSTGRDRKKLRNRETLKALATWGMIIATHVSASPRFTRPVRSAPMNSGTMVISVGIIRTMSTAQKTSLRPGKCRRASAYPAIAPVIRLITVDVTVTTTLFRSHSRTGFLKTSMYGWIVGWTGTHASAWVKTSPGGFSDVEIIWTSGTAHVRAKAMPSAHRNASSVPRSGRRRVTIGSRGIVIALLYDGASVTRLEAGSVGHLPEHPQLHHGDDQNRHEQHHGDGRCVAELILPKPHLVHVANHRLGCVRGAAVGHDVDLAEHPQAGDRQQRQTQAQSGPEQGQRHVPQRLRVVAAVDARRLAQLLGDVLKACEQQDHNESRIPPDRGRRQSDENPFRIGEPADWGNAEVAENLVQ